MKLFFNFHIFCSYSPIGRDSRLKIYPVWVQVPLGAHIIENYLGMSFIVIVFCIKQSKIGITVIER